MLVALMSCGPSRVVPAEYRAGLTVVCDAIDAYGQNLSLTGSGSIVEQAIASEAARQAAGDAFESWVALSVPSVPAALRTQIEQYRATTFDLINRPAELQSDCRSLEAALRPS
jgi:hypothetical protein